MRKTISLAAITMIFGITSTVSATEGMYISANIGAAIPSDSELTDPSSPGLTPDLGYKSGLAVTAALGYDLGNDTRFEGEISYQKNDFDTIFSSGVTRNVTGDANALSLLLNGYYDFATGNALIPYVTAGLGVTNIETNDFTSTGSVNNDTAFAYQIGFGTTYTLSEEMAIDLRYRYLASNNLTFGSTEVEYASHNIYLGVKVNF